MVLEICFGEGSIVGKFGAWCSQLGREGYGVDLWKTIRKGL